MTVPSHNYTDPTAGVEVIRTAVPMLSSPPPLAAWVPLANPVGHARAVGAYLMPSPVLAPDVVCAPLSSCIWSEASRKFFIMWARRRTGWQIHPSGRNR